MRKIITFLAVLVMLFPLSAMAMTPISDTEMADVTGQAGVSINLDITMDLDIGVVSWGDKDGFSTGFDRTTPYHTGDATTWSYDLGYIVSGAPLNTAGGYVGLTTLAVNALNIKARHDTSTTYWPALGARAFVPGANSGVTDLEFLTIDVGSINTTTTWVKIGLGTLVVTMSDMSANVELGTTKNLRDGQKLGEIYLSNLTLYTAPGGYVTIYNARGAGECGVTMGLAVGLDQVKFDAFSWGDCDGVDNSPFATGGPGYVGLANFVANKIGITGTVDIDVAQATAGWYAGAHSAYASGGWVPINPSFIHIGFGQGLGVTMLSMDADVVVGHTQGFTDAISDKSLGSLYVYDVDLQIGAGSWVDILGH